MVFILPPKLTKLVLDTFKIKILCVNIKLWTTKTTINTMLMEINNKQIQQFMYRHFVFASVSTFYRFVMGIEISTF